MTVEACPDIEAADRELLSDLGARLGRGEMIGGTAYAVKCWHALARLEALQPSPETSLQNMQTRGAVGREEVAKALYQRHPAIRFEKGPIGQTPLNRPATWDEATADEREDDLEAADAILALFSSSPTVEGWQPISTAPRDGTYILARVRPNLDDERWGHLAGRHFVIRHEGRTRSDYDLGWSVYPGFGGASDNWFDAWLPLPAHNTDASGPSEGGVDG